MCWDNWMLYRLSFSCLNNLGFVCIRESRFEWGPMKHNQKITILPFFPIETKLGPYTATKSSATELHLYPPKVISFFLPWMCKWVKTCWSPRLISGILLDCPSILFIEAGSLNQTQTLLIKLVSPASLLLDS